MIWEKAQFGGDFMMGIRLIREIIDIVRGKVDASNKMHVHDLQLIGIKQLGKNVLTTKGFNIYNGKRYLHSS